MKGIESVDKAIAIKDDYMEAIAYKNLLLRLQANLIKDPARQQALIREADQLRDRAEQMRKAKNTADQLVGVAPSAQGPTFASGRRRPFSCTCRPAPRPTRVYLPRP